MFNDKILKIEQKYMRKMMKTIQINDGDNPEK